MLERRTYAVCYTYILYFQSVPFHLTKRLMRWRGGRTVKKLDGSGRYQEIHASSLANSPSGLEGPIPDLPSTGSENRAVCFSTEAWSSLLVLSTIVVSSICISWTLGTSGTKGKGSSWDQSTKHSRAHSISIWDICMYVQAQMNSEWEASTKHLWSTCFYPISWVVSSAMPPVGADQVLFVALC